jgi:hypothetical protein
VRGIGITFNAEATEPFSGLVGKLAGVSSTTGLSATINWGDGTPNSQGTIVPLPSPSATAVPLLGIDGTHTYTTAGTYAVNIIVTRQIGPPGSLTPIILVTRIKSTAIVAPDSEGGVTLFEPAFQPFTATVGTFDFVPTPIVGPAAVNPFLSAMIDWGDGKTTPGVIQHINGDDYAVVGTHEYTAVGQYNVHVIVVENLLPPGPTPVTGPTPPTILIADFYSVINALPSPVTSA